MKARTICSFIVGVGVLTIAAGVRAGDRPPIVSPAGEGELLLDYGRPFLLDYGWPTGGEPRGVGPGMQAGADHIVSDQCPNGGWGWSPHGDCSATYNNITGPIGLGLLNAYSNTGDPAHLAAAVAGGDYDLTSQYGNGEARFATFTPLFLWKLTGASGDSTYSDFAATDFFDELTAGTYGPSDYDTAGWIAAVVAGRQGTWVNLIPWEFSTLGVTADAIGNAGQKALFDQAILDGLNTLDNTAPGTVYSDLIGLAGAVRGLSLNGTTSFTAINSPNHAAIDGIDNLCDLTAVLAGYQNADGSWYWHSDLASPAEDDKDTQTSAYAVMALLEADTLCTDYSTQIARGRDWLRSMQLPDGGFLSYPGGSQNTEVEGEAVNALIPDPCTTDRLEFQLGAGSECVQPSETVTVELYQLNLTGLRRGFQAFAQFDSGMMAFGSGTYTSSPYGLPVITPIVAVGDDIDMAAGILDPTQSPTSSDALLVTLTFTAGATDGPTTVSFRANDPPSRFSDEFGGEVLPCLVQSPTIIIDGTDPVITCPADISVNADAGTCEAVLAVGTATATDNLDPSPSVVGVRSDALPLADPYPSGVTTITWTATDCAGNTDVCVQTITVSAFNEMVVDLDLQATVDPGPFTRCITFELWGCPDTAPLATVSEVITFTSGSSPTNLIVLVPCANTYTCVTARDELHTLRRTLDTLHGFGISGTQYVADFAAASKDLIGGNLNDDFWIDILDFGVLSWQWPVNYGTGDTDCSTAFPHADITGDGLVTTGDFTFIQINFLQGHEPNCCGQPGFRGGEEGDGPITEISVAELRRLGLGHLAVGDLNHDGWLNQADIVAFMQGARPKSRPVSLGNTKR